MKISINAIRAFNAEYGCAPDPAADGVDALLTRIGAQLAAVEEVIQHGKKYAGIIIVRVVECRKHEDSDHLNVCMIDDGGVAEGVERNEAGLVQVVCGAPNVRAGLTVVWLPPGSTVPSSVDGGEPFVLGARELRGVLSNGMLASPKELSLGDSHDGILEIDPAIDGPIKPGIMFAEQFNLVDDVVIDMENKMFTHRPDLFGTLGIARELAGIQGQKFTNPGWYQANAVIATPTDASTASSLRVELRNEIPELVPRFVILPMSGITIKPSPVWLQVELSRYGLRPINNIVDLTNYYMLLTGQPLHAYDYDKVVAADPGADHATIVVRNPAAGEKLQLLNGKTVEPRKDAIIIASATQAIGLGGVMGGGNTEVDASTTNIILECATFNMYSIRRTSMAHGLFSDAVTRFNKGQSPLQNMAVLSRIASDIAQLAGGTVAGALIDDSHIPDEVRARGTLHGPETVPAEFINDRLGLQLASEDMVTLLDNVGFHVHDMGGENAICYDAPFWRTDIEIPEDIVEEIGRLYGFDKLPLDLPRRDITPATKNPDFQLKAHMRDELSRAGANEVLSYSFVDGNLLDKVGQNRDLAFKLSNALSPELQYYRLSLTPSLLEKVHANIKAGYDEFALFEAGKGHAVSELDDENVPKEFGRLALVFAAENKKAATSYAGAAFYQARRYLEALFGDELPFTLLPLSEASYDGHAMIEQMCMPYDPARSAVLWNGSYITGVVGEYKPSVQKALKLPKYSAGFEVFLSAFSSVEPKAYIPQPKFPKVWQDICLRVPASVGYQELYDFVKATLASQAPQDTVTQLAPVDIYQKPDDSEHRQITFRYSIASYLRTLTDGEVAKLLDLVANQAAEKFAAERV